MDGIELIAAERQRQITEEGFTPEHDDQWTDGQLASAALCYLAPWDQVIQDLNWPWAKEWWKPSEDDELHNLIKAGALIAAEIDRITRLQEARNVEQERQLVKLTKVIQVFVNQFGWTKFEEMLQSELGLTLVDTEQGKRVYRTEDGDLKATIRELEIEAKQ